MQILPAWLAIVFLMTPLEFQEQNPKEPENAAHFYEKAAGLFQDPEPDFFLKENPDPLAVKNFLEKNKEAISWLKKGAAKEFCSFVKKSDPEPDTSNTSFRIHFLGHGLFWEAESFFAEKKHEQALENCLLLLSLSFHLGQNFESGLSGKMQQSALQVLFFELAKKHIDDPGIPESGWKKFLEQSLSLEQKETGLDIAFQNDANRTLRRIKSDLGKPGQLKGIREKEVLSSSLEEMLGEFSKIYKKAFESNRPELLESAYQSIKTEAAQYRKELKTLHQQCYESKSHDSCKKIAKIFFELIVPAPVNTLTLYYESAARMKLLSAALTLKLYRLQKGEFPKTLELLMPEFLPEIPKDPFADFSKISYRQRDNQCLLYSWGPDHKDDQGQSDDIVISLQLAK